MVKVERKKELLKWFVYGRIKSDVSYSTLLKKTGGNGKGFLDRYFVLHRNYFIYYKPGKFDSKPDDIQEPQGYINLGECTYDETKSLNKTQPLTFQISHKSGRLYFIKTKDEKTIEHILLLVKQRIKSLAEIGAKESLGNTEENLKTISNLLPRTMKLPDRVKPDLATKWIMEMSEYYESYREWEPYLVKIEQFSEICHGPTKEYVDWFVGSEGPRLSMIRCEEMVLENWSEFIRKTSQEINSYEETRFFSEDYQDIIKHVKNMILLIDSYNLYMRQCRHKSVKYVDKYLEEKSAFTQHLEQYNKMPTSSSIQFTNATTSFIKGEIKATFFIKSTNVTTPDLTTDSTGASNNNNNNFSDEEEPQEEPQHQYEDWRFSNDVLSFEGIDGDTNSEETKERWTFSNGYFRNERCGDVLWNNKTWVWSHQKTDYKIRFDWDNISGSFVYYQPKTNSSMALHHTPSKLSLSTSKKAHPSTVYADWRLSKNIVLHSVVIGNKLKPAFSSLQVDGVVPLPAMLIIAMNYHIKQVLEHFNIK